MNSAIRLFGRKDTSAIVNMLMLNTPKFFAPSEEKDLMDYLEKIAQNYFVVEGNSKVFGAGGINFGFDGGKTARISWDIIHPSYQGKGIGTKLLQFRIDQIKKREEVQNVVVRTTQLVYMFYEKNGFVLESISKDYWAKGLDLYQMKMDLEMR